MKDERDWGPRPFRFLNSWIEQPSFLEVVYKSWTETEIEGWAGYCIFKKMEVLKLKLKAWSRSNVGNIIERLKLTEEKLHELDRIAEERGLESEEIARRREVMGEVWKLSRWVERDWLQKSRLNWSLQGDSNSRFFHCFANHRRRINMINSVVVNDQIVEETEAVKAAVKVHFQKQFSEQWCNRPFFAANTGKGIDEFSARTLEAKFTEDEIWKAVKDCDGNKAPGPDGFNFNFIKKCWKTIKDLIVLFFKEFHSNARLMGGLIHLLWF